MKKALTKTDFNFPGQKSVYHGKVRDVYNINDEVLVMVATIRRSPAGRYPLQRTDAEPDRSQIPGCNYRHLPELETGYSRSDGDRRRDVPGISC